MQLTGSAVLLTGASRGIGAILAEHLARAGAHLVLTARDAQKLDDVRARCAAHGVRVRTFAADVARAGDRERLVREAGPIDILINNAGVETTVAFADQTLTEIQAQVETNLMAPMHLTRLVLPGMIDRRRGTIVNISSMSGKAATPFNAVYAATKFGLNGFTASVRLELEGSGVHAGVVCPSFVGAAGMWADTGLRPPALIREVKPEKVVRAVFAVLDGAPEVLVTSGPMRPLLALAQLFPTIDGPFLRRFGVMDVFRSRASAHKIKTR